MFGFIKGRFGRWGSLGSAYNNSLTLMEKIKVLKEMCADLYENEVEINTRLDELYKFVDTGFEEYVGNKLDELVANGKLAEIINEDIFNLKADKKDLNGVSLVVFSTGIDDTNNIQTAINTIKTMGGGTLTLPSPTYKSKKLTITDMQNLTIISEGLIEQIENSADGFIIVTGSSNISLTMRIKGLNVAVSSKTGYQYHGIRVDKCENITIKNSEISHMTSGGIVVTDSTKVRVIDNHLHDNIDMFDIAVGYSTPNVVLKDVFVNGNICESRNRWGIHIQGYGKDVSVIGNHVRNQNEYGILVYRHAEQATGTEVWENVTVSSNIVENITSNPNPALSYKSGMGIYLQTITKLTCSDNVVRNVLQGRTETPVYRTLIPGAISIGSSREITVTGNLIEGSGVDGIGIANIDQISEGSTIANNTVLNVKYAGIYLNGGGNVTINGNTLKGSGGTGGVIVGSTSALNSKQVTITSNNIVGGFNSGINVTNGAGTTVSDVVISSNAISNVIYQYINVANASNISVTGNMCSGSTTQQNAEAYTLSMVSVDVFTLSNNITKGLLTRGILVNTCSNGIVTGNVVGSASDLVNAMNFINNTKVFYSLNNTNRHVAPFISEYAVGTNFADGSPARITYQTSQPTTGYWQKGSVCYNLNPVAGGSIGWVCVENGTPGTWKPFGTIGS